MGRSEERKGHWDTKVSYKWGQWDLVHQNLSANRFGKMLACARISDSIVGTY